jgi:hypothetical protein
MIVPCIHDTFCKPVSASPATSKARLRTSDVLLLWCCLLWTRSFLDVHNELLIGLILVYWTRGIVYFVAINVIV